MEIEIIKKRIYEVRRQKVMLDFHLADLYDTETRILKQAVRRNLKRFPEDFMFELTKAGYNSLRSQIVTLKNSGRGKHSKYLPFAFTEQGVAMLSSVLNNPKAIDVNIQIMRAFVLLRKFALTHQELTERLKELPCRYTGDYQYFISESSVYRILKKAGLINPPAFDLVPAADQFRDQTNRINEMWQTGFTFLKTIGWG